MATLFIKNMVCNRCIMAVKYELNQLAIPFYDVRLGEVFLKNELNTEQRTALEEVLNRIGFEIIDDRKSRIIEQIKSVIIDEVQSMNGDHRTNLSDVLSNKLHFDYNYLSNLFSEVEGSTIEKFFIAQKIEKVKELLVYDELTLSEIAFRLAYSSVAYLSNQFKKTTGLTPSHFKKIGANRRKSLDKV